MTLKRMIAAGSALHALAMLDRPADVFTDPPILRRPDPVKPSVSRRAKVKAARRQARKNRKCK